MNERVILLGRSLCPTCGAPMTPGTTEDVHPCAFCGTRSHVVRRLRTIEPISVGGLEPGLVVGRPDAAAPMPDGETAPCPGCGGALETDARQELVLCPSCSSFVKVERQLEPGAVGALADYPTRKPAGGVRAWTRARRDRRRDAAYRRVIDEPDAGTRVNGVLDLDPWEELTPDREETFVQLLESVAAGTLLEAALCHLVHRFLQAGPKDADGFTDHPWRYFVLRAVARVAFREEASGRLVQELRYVRGGGAALKLLLDIADYALTNGQLDYAEDALEVVGHTVADNLNWDRRHDMYDLLAYRLPYADERLAAWLLHQTSVEWIGFLKPRALARLVDDCVLERPQLAPVVANRGSYVPCSNLGEYLDHLAFLQTLFTPLGRAIALECLIYVPSRGSGDLDAEVVGYVTALLEAMRTVPESEIAATRILRWWIDDLSTSSSEAVRGVIGALSGRVPADPTWPPPPRPTPYDRRLEKLARRVGDGVRQRSALDRDGDLPDAKDVEPWQRWIDARDRIDAERHEQRQRAIRQQYSGSRLYWILNDAISTVLSWIEDTIWRFRNPGGHG
jgi:predicted RNA-binding Zn-ribbon protein involved in translation (DUF1610 family)